ncbi:MAG: hypothetical protein AB7N31_18310 [Pyrinomonadaceae bacterium]
MRNFSRRLTAPLLIAVFAMQAIASEVTLKNGDRVSGTIVEQSEDAVVVETEYAGKIRIARSHIAAIAATA